MVLALLVAFEEVVHNKIKLHVHFIYFFKLPTQNFMWVGLIAKIRLKDEKGWELMVLCCSSFPPSKEFMPFLATHFQQVGQIINTYGAHFLTISQVCYIGNIVILLHKQDSQIIIQYNTRINQFVDPCLTRQEGYCV